MSSEESRIPTSEFRTSRLLIVVLVVLVDLMGFTIVMPLLPRFADEYGFSKLRIGLLLAAFPLCQLVAGPILGRLSDRIGRRPVLVFSQAGTALSFLILAFSRHYWVMLLARMLDGASGGNYLVAQAYIADCTKPEDRARGFGLFGAAFGLGFVLGPLLAGLILELPVRPDWQLRLPFLVAAGFSTLAYLLVLTRLPESTDEAHREAARVLSWRGLVDTVSMPRIGTLVVLGTLVTLAFSALEGTFALYLKERFGASARVGAFGYALLGFVGVVIQGGLIRGLVPRFGEPRLIVVGLALMALGLAGLAVVTTWPGLIATTIVLGSGYSVAGPSGMGLLSRLTPATEQGAVFGVLTSAQTLARMLNYPIANILFGRSGPTAAYWEGAVIAAVGLLLALWVAFGWIGSGAPQTQPDKMATGAVGE
jgi:DHA1 family tetracycline resistance protein-like MFS transporter